MTLTAAVLFADGFEEIEGLTPCDVLQRAGFQVEVVGVGSRNPVGAHKIQIAASIEIVEAAKNIYDVVVLPGGMPGASNLANCNDVISLLKNQQEKDKHIAAICASPAVVLAKKGLFRNAKGVCYPSCEADMGSSLASSTAPVHVENKIITSRGPGTAIEFSLTIVKEIAGRAKAEEIAKALLYDF